MTILFLSHVEPRFSRSRSCRSLRPWIKFRVT